METIKHTFLFSVLLLIFSPFAGARPMTDTERLQLKIQLDSILKSNQDECFINISNINSIDILSQSLKNKKTFVDKKTKDIYVSDRISSTFNLNATDLVLPEGNISNDSPTSFSVNYARPVNLDVVKIRYDEIQTHSFIQGLVVHYFEFVDGQPDWKYSTMDIAEGNDQKPHVRCKSKGQSGFQAAKAAAKSTPSGSFIFLDLELSSSEQYCSMPCQEPLTRTFPKNVFF